MLIDVNYLLTVRPKIAAITYKDTKKFGRVWTIVCEQRPGGNYTDQCELTDDDFKAVLQKLLTGSLSSLPDQTCGDCLAPVKDGKCDCEGMRDMVEAGLSASGTNGRD
jgi:hypothetical protein